MELVALTTFSISNKPISLILLNELDNNMIQTVANSIYAYILYQRKDMKLECKLLEYQ